MRMMRNCLACDKPFEARSANHRLCSHSCRVRFRRNATIEVGIITPELEHAIQSDIQPFDVRIRGTDRVRGEAGSSPPVGSTPVQPVANPFGSGEPVAPVEGTTDDQPFVSTIQ